VATLGSHTILELYDCPSDLLDDEYQVRAFVREAATRARCTLLGELSHHFEPQGVTAIALLAESHISAHTWPEAGYVAVDIFTCGESTLPEEAARYLCRMFEARRHEIRRLERGLQAHRPAAGRRPTPHTGGAGQPVAATDA